MFVIEAAEAMAEESQNALLKTLEEPPPFAHLVLLSAEPAALLETVRSRCQAVRFAPATAGGGRGCGSPDAARAGRRRAPRGRPARRRRPATGATFLLGDEGRELRAAAERCARAARSGELGERPGADLLAAAEAAGQSAGEADAARASRSSRPRRATSGPPRGAARARPRRPRGGPRGAPRTEALDLGLALIAAWLRDLAAVAEGAAELVLNADRADELAARAEGLDPRAPGAAAELVMDTRRRLHGERQRGAGARGARVSPGSTC